MPLYLTCKIDKVIEIKSTLGKITIIVERQKCSRNSVRIGIDAPEAFTITRGLRKDYDDDRKTSMVNDS